METEPKLRLLLSHQDIAAAIRRLADRLKADYHGKQPLLVGVLKGSFVFMADLIRALDFPLEVDFVRLASYGEGMESSGKVEVRQEMRAVVEGRHVLVVDDIIDTGLTTSFFLDYLRSKKPASLRLCALTDKPSRRKVPVAIDYLGFTVPDKFLVGYGLDWNEKFRNLPEIYILEF